jgi:MFS family permease
MVFGVLYVAALSLNPGTQQLSTALQLGASPASSCAFPKPQLVAARSHLGLHELSRPRQKQLTVLAVAFALCNDVLLLLMLVPMLPFLLPAGATSQFALSCESPNITPCTACTLHVHRMHTAYAPHAHSLSRCLFSTKDACQLLCAPFMGALTLRIGPRRTLAASLLGLAAATLAFAEASSLRELLAARALQGAASAALMSGGLTLVAEEHTTEERGGAIAHAQMGLGVGAAAGPVLGGLLLESVGRRAAFFAAAVLVALNAALVLYLEWAAPRPPSTPPPPPPPPPLPSASPTSPRASRRQPTVRGEPPARQLLTLLRCRPVAIIAAGTMAQYAAGGLYDSTFGVHMHEAFDVGPAKASLAFALEPLSYLLILLRLSPLANRGGARRKPRFAAAGLALIAASLPVLSLGRSRVTVAASLLLHGAGYAFKDAASHGLLAELVDTHGVGTYAMAFALADAADSAGYIVGPPLGAALMGVLGRTPGLALCAVAVLLLVPAHAQLRSTPE